MKGNRVGKIFLIVAIAVLLVTFTMSRLSTLKATDEGDAVYGETIPANPDEALDAPGGATEYVAIPEATEEAQKDGVPAPEEEDAAEPADRSVKISTQFVGGKFHGFGTEVLMTANLSGYEDVTPSFQWQYSADNGGSWQDVEGANEQTYTFELTAENYTYSWRVEVKTEGVG